MRQFFTGLAVGTTEYLPQDFEIYSKVIPDPFQGGVLCTVDGCYFGQETVDGEIVDKEVLPGERESSGAGRDHTNCRRHAEFIGLL